MSTAITRSAPICRAKRTGTGDTSPPSTYSREPMRTGWNTAGIALDARTAVPASPRWNRMGCPLPRSVATMPSGMRMRSIGMPARLLIDIAGQRLAADHAAKGKGPIGDGRLVHAFGKRCQLRWRLARGIQRRDEAAGGGARNEVGLDAVFLQHLDHADMGKAACRPSAKGQADPRWLGQRLGRGLQHDRWSDRPAAAPLVPSDSPPARRPHTGPRPHGAKACLGWKRTRRRRA